MKKFKDIKDIEQIQKEAIDLGWKVDITELQQLSSWFWLRDVENRKLEIRVNYYWGNFFVYSLKSGHPLALEYSQEFDNEDWYNEILELIYIPLED